MWKLIENNEVRSRGKHSPSMAHTSELALLALHSRIAKECLQVLMHASHPKPVKSNL